MRMTLRLLLAAAAIAAPVLLTAPASANSPVAPNGTPYQEVAAARDGQTQTRAQRRQRREAAAQRRHRQSGQRAAQRRARPAATAPAGQG
ncbi:hypothetical protein G3576_24020 [Roseomonas stagni]|uniref:Uncharacterized protein n=1 Tax=Falsiroseomonas algicola TaxID=2716930 RepID=A0A6M1LRP7_9PROT|nr:hypothetical protein [Falsiroseomonas algicola]NGM23101.1 hypothetical protein [Falsiroseomonas algicola]